MAVSAAPGGMSPVDHGCICALDLDLESDWLAGNMLPGENQNIFILQYF